MCSWVDIGFNIHFNSLFFPLPVYMLYIFYTGIDIYCVLNAKLFEVNIVDYIQTV